jgi:hypothetical protein
MPTKPHPRSFAPAMSFVTAITLGALLVAGIGSVDAEANTKKSKPLATQVADGQPWSMTTDDGRSVELTLFPDGTAQMRAGIMTMRPTWTATTNGLCLDGMMGKRCMTLKKVKGGFDTYSNGAKRGSLRR